MTGIYENEMAIRLSLVANNSSLIYTNADTDPYTNTNAFLLLNQNQTNLDAVIGDANYDIGHVFSTGGGGLAGLSVVGISGLKAFGETGLSAPIGDVFYVDFVAHEFGHQFGANHTFNGVTGSCSSSNRNSSSAYEPGSGSTILAYAGICGSDNLQNTSDAYFHHESLREILAHVATIPNAGSSTATGNNLPTANAGLDFTIPALTPFVLTATATDADLADQLTYTWEQRDLGSAQAVNAGDNGSSPIFRSFSPTTDATRTFPRLTDLLNQTGILGETLPTTNRTLNFRVTVRDNRANGGGIDDDDMVVNVVDTGQAFQVSSFNSTTSLTGGSSHDFTWIVAGTTGNGINTANVNILFSSDGGNTFPTVVAANVPNDGLQAITIPNVDTSQGRFKVEAVGNIFFDISNVNVTIQNSQANTPPTITDIANQTINEDESTGVLSFTIGDTETAVESLLVTFTSSNLTLIPASHLTLGGTGAFRTIIVTPDTSQFGTATINVTVTDQGGLSASDSFQVQVISVNDDPAIGDIANQTINEDESTGVLSFTISDTETVVESLLVTATSSDSTLIPASRITLGGTGASRTIIVTPDTNQFGTATINVTVTDQGGLSASDSFQVQVNSVNDDPTISDIANQTINQDTSVGPLDFTITDVETAAANLTVIATSSNQLLLPDGNIELGGSGSSRQITITPAAGQTGLANITVTVTDEGGKSASDAIVLEVTSTAMIIDDGDAGFDQGGFTKFLGQGFLNDVTYSASGNGNTASWTFSNLPVGAYSVAATWTPQENRATDAPYSVTGSAMTLVIQIDQENPPNDFTDQGASWENLGTPVNVNAGELTVTLSDMADQFVIADAIRVQRVGDIQIGPEIQVQDGVDVVSDGVGSVDIGTTTVGTDIQKTITIKNVGNSVLTLQPVSKTGSSVFTITANIAPNTTLAPNATTSFTINLDGSSTGSFAGGVSFANDDADENPFDFLLSGNVTSATSTVIIDDGDADFEPEGFLVFVGQGFQDDVHFSAANSGNTATWNFDNLASGRYQVAATWTPQENRATDAPFTLGASLAGANHSGDVVVTVNQENGPDDFVDTGIAWENLGSPLTVTGGSLSVSLSDAADEFVIADGIRIERIGDIASGPEIQILDGASNVDDGSHVNLGIATVGQNIEKTLIVQNIGTAMLELQPAVISGDSEISITTNFAPNTMLAPNAEAMLVIQLDATSEGTFNASLQFTNGDDDESPF